VNCKLLITSKLNKYVQQYFKRNSVVLDYYNAFTSLCVIKLLNITYLLLVPVQSAV